MKKNFRKVYIEITNNCNLSCSFCSEVKKPKRMMKIDEFEHILKEIKDKTNYIYLHVKGEPLLHPNIVDFLNLAEKYNLKVNLTTNGTLFPKVVDKIKDCKALHKLNFSLHSENDIPNYLENIFESVKKLSPEVVVIYRLWTLNNGLLDKKPTETVEKLKTFYNLPQETVEKIKNENNIKITSTIYVDKDNEFAWPNLEGDNSTGFCHALKTHIAILVDGTIVPCCLDSNGIINLGNIYQQSLNDIIESKRYQDLKKSFQDNKPCEELCKKCSFKLRFK